MAANVVTPDKKIDDTSKTGKGNENIATVEITGITTGAEIPAVPPNPPFHPPRAGTMFARFIDDIFQVSIVVYSILLIWKS